MSISEAMLLGFPESGAVARRVADYAGAPYGEIAVHRFPDGESRLTLPSPRPDHVILYRSLDRPHDKLVELLLASRTLRAEGVRCLTLMAPYLCYMRQDAAFEAGQVISQRVMGEWLAHLFDVVMTVDPHLHRVARLEQAVPVRRAIVISAGPAFADYLQGAGRVEDALLLGPDSESEQWVCGIAKAANLPHAIAQKHRRGDRSVAITLPAEVSFRKRRVILLDDMASTGRTLAAAVEQTLLQGAAEVRILVTHALFVNDSLAHLRQSPIAHIGSSDTIPHETNVVSLVPTLGGALRDLLGQEQRRG